MKTQAKPSKTNSFISLVFMEEQWYEISDDTVICVYNSSYLNPHLHQIKCLVIINWLLSKNGQIENF